MLIELPLPLDLEIRIKQCVRLAGVTLGLWIVQACYKTAHEEEEIVQSCTWPIPRLAEGSPTGAYAPPAVE